jgi:hypothetical protein
MKSTGFATIFNQKKRCVVAMGSDSGALHYFEILPTVKQKKFFG